MQMTQEKPQISPLTTLQRYNLEAQRAIDQAKLEAQQRGSLVVTVADLLAGLSWEQGTRADRIASLKNNATYLRWLLELPAMPFNRPTAAEEPIAMDHGAKIALAYAWAEADRDEEPLIGTDHILRGLLRFPNVANFALLKLEVRLQSSRVASRLDREELFSEDAPVMQVYQYKLRQYVTRWAPSILGIACYLYIVFQGIQMSLVPATK